MANYSLVINSKFRPFEYQELLAPVLMATQAHQQLEDAYGELSSKASIWDKLTNPETDKDAHSIYSAYAKDLESQAEDLARYGLNPSSRQQILNMRGRYSRDIVPIEDAYKRREEQIAEQRKAGNSMIYDYEAATTSLDKFLDNPSLSYRSIDRKDLRNRSEVAYSKFKEQLREGLKGFGYDRARKLDKFHNTLVQTYGLSPEQAASFINAVQSGNLSETDAALRATYNAIYNGTGVDSWGSEEAKNAVMNTILEGVNAGIGKEQASLVEDTQAKIDAELARSKELERYRATLEEEKKKRDATKSFLMPRVDGGVDTSDPELLDIQARTKGLRKIGNSFTTDTLVDKAKKLRKAEEEYNSFMSGENATIIENALRYREMQRGKAKMSGSGEVMTALQTYGPESANLGKYEKLKKQVKEARDSYNSEQQYLKSLKEKYSFLGGNSYDNVRVGIELEKMQRKQDNSSYALNLKETSYNDVLQGLNNVLGAATEAEYPGVGLRQVGKSSNVSREKMREILADKDGTSIRVKGGMNGGLQIIDSKGNAYTVEGISNITKANKDLSVTSHYLGTFDNESVKGAKLISDEQYRELLQRGKVPNISVGDTKRIGSSYRGITLYNSRAHDYIKVMLDDSGNILAINNLGSELAGGANRDAYFTSMASSTLGNLINLLATKAE